MTRTILTATLAMLVALPAAASDDTRAKFLGLDSNVYSPAEVRAIDEALQDGNQIRAWHLKQNPGAFSDGQVAMGGGSAIGQTTLTPDDLTLAESVALQAAREDNDQPRVRFILQGGMR